MFTGCAALATLIVDNYKTFSRNLTSLPPWAVEINQNINIQVIGKIIKVVETNNKDLTLYIQIEKYLTKGKADKIEKGKGLKLRVYKQMHKELIYSYARNNLIGNDSNYLISFKTSNNEKVEYQELVTIDQYVTE